MSDSCLYGRVVLSGPRPAAHFGTRIGETDAYVYSDGVLAWICVHPFGDPSIPESVLIETTHAALLDTGNHLTDIPVP